MEIENQIGPFKAHWAQDISATVKGPREIQAPIDEVAYSVHSIPPEIMSHIFIGCLPNDGEVRPSSRCAPLLLMRVCRRWKDIALSTCQLWSSLDIDCIVAERRPWFRRGTLRGMETWFSRAHTLPLSLKIEYSKKSSQNPEDISELEPLSDLSALLPRAGRLTFGLHMMDWPMLVPAATPLLQLRSLTALLWDADLEYVIKNAPRLAELSWMRGLDRTLEFCPFASDTLTKLDIVSTGFSTAQFIGVLQHLPKLSHLACYVTPRDAGACTPLSFPNLRTLGLRRDFSGSAYSIDALALVTLPCLFHLEYDSWSNPNVLLPFLSRSECVIRELGCQILPIGTTAAEVRRKLGPFLHIEKLVVEMQLRHIRLTYWSTYVPIDYRLVVDFVRRRQAAVDANTPNPIAMAKLESLHITIDSKSDWPPTPTIENELRELISSGVDLKVRTADDDIEVWPEDRRV
ncbi:F-box domain-containing protein [Mycena sanguinolenta]|uniref:F-box domain-containing protein n=1 Tax=Mycena sanguinolenta TaxID=230812 RepID=A0A8H7CZ25_9AGAR|nr:F-box domain-containing protein [Mycena sanguinolenta]